MITLTCPHCQRQIKTADSNYNKRAKCPHCKGVITVVPDAAPQAEPAPQPIAYATPAPAATKSRPKPPKGTSGFGLAALVVGIIALLFCWVPFVGMLAIPLAVIALLLAFVGAIVSLVGKRSTIGLQMAGGVCAVLAIVVAIMSTGGTSAAISASLQQAAKQNAAQAATPVNTNAPPPTSPAAVTVASATQAPAPSPLAATPPEPAEDWIDASQSVRVGDIEIKVDRVVVGKVALKDVMNGSTTSQNDLLAIHLTLTNRSPNRKIDYHTWAGADMSFTRDFATVKDDVGNTYKRIDFGFGTTPEGQTKSTSVYPGKSVQDVLVFEAPVSDVKNLDLEMPANNVGEKKGMVRLRIAAAKIERS